MLFPFCFCDSIIFLPATFGSTVLSASCSFVEGSNVRRRREKRSWAGLGPHIFKGRDVAILQQRQIWVSVVVPYFLQNAFCEFDKNLAQAITASVSGRRDLMAYVRLLKKLLKLLVEPPRCARIGPKIPDWMSNNLAGRENKMTGTTLF